MEPFSDHPLGAADDQGPASSGPWEVQLEPGDGLFLLPDGLPPDRAALEDWRQTFFPDARRLYEEIDRFGVDAAGETGVLSRLADYEFLTAAPPAGDRTAGARLGHEFYPYSGDDRRRADPTRVSLAEITNVVQLAAASGRFAGIQWLEGSPSIEETLYWLSLLIDTAVPLVGQAAQGMHRSLDADGAANLRDGVRWIVSDAWRDGCGGDRAGAVLVADGLVLPARDVVKTAGRPGGFRCAGSAGAIATVSGARVRCDYAPVYRHGRSSALLLGQLPAQVTGVRAGPDGVGPVPVDVRDEHGALCAHALPNVRIIKLGRYDAGDCEICADGSLDVDVWVSHNLSHHPLAGFVCEARIPDGGMAPRIDAALRAAVLVGLPVVKCGRGSPDGPTHAADPLFVGGGTLTAPKARMLLMASLLRLGCGPVAADPRAPWPDERRRAEAWVAQIQEVFDTH